MTPAQSQIQDQLQRKHEELQHLIVQQQEELRRVSEQLLMARYGLLPSIVNVSLPPSSAASTTSRQPVNSTVTHLQHGPPTQNQVPMIEHSGQGQGEIDAGGMGSVQAAGEMVSYMQLNPVPSTHLHQNQGPPGEMDVPPYQMGTPDRNQMMFDPGNLRSPVSDPHSQ